MDQSNESYFHRAKLTRIMQTFIRVALTTADWAVATFGSLAGLVSAGNVKMLQPCLHLIPVVFFAYNKCSKLAALGKEPMLLQTTSRH